MRRPVVFAAAGGLVGLGVLAAQPEVQGWEAALFAGVNRLGAGWWLPLYLVMQAGALPAGPVAGAVALLARRRRLAAELAGSSAAAWVLARVVKLLVGRPRPGLLLPGVVLRGAEQGGLGYPSGHVTIATTLAVVVSGRLPARWQWLPWLVPALVGLARMHIGAHLPLDIAGGLLLGILVGLSARLLSDRVSAVHELRRSQRDR